MKWPWVSRTIYETVASDVAELRTQVAELSKPKPPSMIDSLKEELEGLKVSAEIRELQATIDYMKKPPPADATTPGDYVSPRLRRVLDVARDEWQNRKVASK